MSKYRRSLNARLKLFKFVTSVQGEPHTESSFHDLSVIIQLQPTVFR